VKPKISRLVLFVLAVATISVAPVFPQETPEEEWRYVVDGPVFSLRSGESFDIRVRISETDDGDDIQVRLPRLPEGLSAAGNPTVLSRELRSAEVRIPLQASRPGHYILEGIEIAAAGETREVEPILVSIASSDGTVPYRARWHLPEERITQSQTTPVLLEIVGADEYLFPEDISYRAPETGLFEEVAGLGEVSTRTVGGTTVYDIPVAAFLFTPAGSGTITIPEASVGAAGMSVQASAVTVDALPLPSAVSASNAVGSFTVSHTVSSEQIRSDETVTVELVLEGVGNLPVADFPQVVAEGLVETDRTETSTIEADRDELRGYRGIRTRTIFFEAEGDTTEAELSIGGYAYFDPLREETGRFGARRYLIEITGDGENLSEDQVPELPLLGPAELARPRWYRLEEARWIYYFLFLGPVIFGVTALWSVRRRSRHSGRRPGVGTLVGIVPILVGAALFPTLNWQRLETAHRLIDEGRQDVAAVLYDLELADNDWHGGLHYNRGVLSLRLDRPVLATYHLRRAVRLAPEDRAFRAALVAAEDYFDLEEQIDLPGYIRPDIFIIGLIVLWTAFWIFLFFRRRLRTTLGLVGIGMIMIVTAGGLVWSWNLDRQRDGVVTEEVHVRRIPDIGAVPWVRLEEAHAVRVELEYDDFFLIRTRTGLNGWVPRDTVRTKEQ
jgi:hypothetical protein